MERHSRLLDGKAYAVSREPDPSQSNTETALRDRSPRSVPEPRSDSTSSGALLLAGVSSC